VTYDFCIHLRACDWRAVALTSADLYTFVHSLQQIQLENSYKRFQKMTGWLNDLVTTATADLRRTQCAEAATARLQNAQVNLLGLGDSGGAMRRAKCLEAAMLRFVLGNEPSQPQPRGRGTKRKAHTALLRELATQWGGAEGFNPLLCGRGRSIKPRAREPWETNNVLI
jgi:hypothetical protein